MSIYPFPAPLTTEQAAAKIWTIRFLRRHGSMDSEAARTSLRPLVDHPNSNVSRLAAQSLGDVYRQLIRASADHRVLA